MQCDCRDEINFTVQFPDYKILDPTSHEYQFQGFIYACVMLLNYFCLTTFIMIKLMLFKPNRPPISLEMDESKKANEDMLKKFREREKKVNATYEIEARRHVKQQMIDYLKSMQTLPGFTTGLAQTVSVDTSTSGQEISDQSDARRGSESAIEEEIEEIWNPENDWDQTSRGRYERRMGVVNWYESETEDDSMTEYFL